jgi:hypothetical protein
MFLKMVAQPESERPQSTLLLEILSHPGCVRSKGPGDIPHERGEKSLAGLGGGTFEYHTERRIDIEAATGIVIVLHRSVREI